MPKDVKEMSLVIKSERELPRSQEIVLHLLGGAKNLLHWQRGHVGGFGALGALRTYHLGSKGHVVALEHYGRRHWRFVRV